MECQKEHSSFFKKSLSNWSNSSNWTKHNYTQITLYTGNYFQQSEVTKGQRIIWLGNYQKMQMKGIIDRYVEVLTIISQFVYSYLTMQNRFAIIYYN